MITQYAFIETLRVRGIFVGPAFLIGLLYLIELSFWSTATNDNPIGHYNRADIIHYILWSVLVFQLTTVAGLTDSLSEYIEEGQIERFLLLPKNLLVFFLQYGVGQLLARIFLFSPFILGVIFFSGTSPTLWLLPAFLLAGLIINICFTFALSCLTFKFRDAYAFVIIKDTLAWMLSGALIPLDLFPLVFQRVFQFLPFQYVAFMPTQVALGIFNWRSFILLLIVLISMILIANILWLRLSKSNQGYSNHD